MMKKYKVAVNCFTYNQEQFIADTLNGFCEQKTTFPYICVVVDDASKDGEPIVIDQYLEDFFCQDTIESQETDDYKMVLKQHRKNPNCFFAVLYLKYNHYRIRKPKKIYYRHIIYNSEYTAYCEGDDYWTDAFKLQTQVDYMDAHLDHSMCYHANLRLYPNGHTVEIKNFENDIDDCSVDNYIMQGFGSIRINTMLYRNSMYPGYQWADKPPVGDGAMCLTLFETGKVAYINRIMSCTRLDTAGSWHKRIITKKKKRYEHYKRVLKLWNEYDKWTEGQHHSVVARKIRLNKKSFYTNELLLFIKAIVKK